MKYILISLVFSLFFAGFIGCAPKKSTEINTETKSEVIVPAGPISVAEALPKLVEWSDKTITVTAQYIGNYGSGETLTFRLVDSIESTEELECVFELPNAVELQKVNFGPLTISGIVWNNQLVKCKIVE